PRILEAARLLDYRADELARTMATGRSGTIGVVVGDIENPFFGLAVRGIGDCAKEAGFDVILSNSAEDVAAERAAVNVLTAKGVDGLIVAPSAMHEKAHLQDALARASAGAARPRGARPRRRRRAGRRQGGREGR